MTTDLTPGSVLGRYELLIQVAQGSIAQVWAARLRGTRGFQKIVAIKTLTTNNDTRALTQALLFDEVRLASLVHHPNVVGTLELGEERGILFIVMEWIHGETLRAVVRASYQYGGMPRTLAVNIIAQACKALHAAHETRDAHGKRVPLIHRDISPQNVMVTYSGAVKVADFGVAKAHHWNAELTGRTEMKRKIAYMSPEQLMANGIDCRSDVFAMGTVLYLITTGQHPFKGSSPEETIQNACFHDPVAPTELARDYPLALEHVVLKALAKDPSDRWSTAGEMLDALLQAEPATSERQVDQRLAQFMNNTIGDMGKNRMQLVHHAQQWVDSQRSPDSTSSVMPPPLPRRSRRESAITLSSVSVSSIPPISERAPSSELVPRHETTASKPPLPPRASRAHSSRAFDPRAFDSTPSAGYTPSKPTSIRRDVGADSMPYTPVPVDTSRRSDWGAHVAPRRDVASQVLRWVGGAGVIALLALLAVRETRRVAPSSAAKAEPILVLPSVEDTSLECSGSNLPELPVEAPTVNVNDLPKFEPKPLAAVAPAQVMVNATPKSESVPVAASTPKKTASGVKTTSAELAAPSTPAARKVDAWDPNHFGGRN